VKAKGENKVISNIKGIFQSPEVMTHSEARRKSHRASSLGLGAGSSVNGSRKSSITSVNPVNSHRRRSTFENVGLTRNVKKRESTSALIASRNNGKKIHYSNF
jgi:hypothetical protein